MNKVRQLLEQASDRLELPADIIAGVPRVELIGNGQCSVEPHKGLLEYTTEQIKVSTKSGVVSVIGSDMQIKRMNSECITVCGTIYQIILTAGGDE